MSEPSDSEAYQALLARAHRKTGRVPAETLVRQVLMVTAGGDWPLQCDALDATLRRCASAHAGDVEITKRPRGRALGLYRTRRRGSPAPPYRTLLRSADPLDGSCDCPDFVRNALGLCRHIIAVLGDVPAKRPTRRAQPVVDSVPLRWDPIRPLTGPGDWLARVQWVGTVPARGLRKWMRPTPSARANEWMLVTPADPRKRLAVVERLLSVLQDGNGEPALHRLLQDERARLERERQGARVGTRLRRALRLLKQPLYPYQQEGVERFLSRGRLLLADDMGLGKTAQAIAACHALWATGQVRRGLLVVPAALKPQWIREWQSFTATPAAVVDGGPAERRTAFERCRRGFLIVNYEQLIRDVDVVRDWSPDIVILDEAQRIKNWATRTALSVKRLDPPYRLVLTGTPMENRLDELASIVEWVDDHALEPKWRLTSWHTAPAEGDGPGGARHLDTLRARLAPCLLRRVRRDVLSQLPSRTDTRIPIEMTAEQIEEHDALDMPIAQILARTQRRPLTHAEFLRLMSLLTTQRVIANGLAQLRFEQIWPELSRMERPTEATMRGLASPKLLELRELIAQLAVTQGRKVVVFSQWRRMLRLAHWTTRHDLASAGVRAAFFTGEEGQKRRTRNIVDFHDDPSCRVLFATDAGGVGLNLQRVASACINIELPWNPAVLEQRIGRIYRLGQRRPIDVYNLVSEPGIESRIAGVLGSKQALFTGLFDGTTDDVAFDRGGTFLSRLERIVAPAGGMTAGAAQSSGPDDISGEAAIDALLEAGNEAHDRPAAGDGAVTMLPAIDIERLISGVTVQRTPAGGLTIEAPPETAATLTALFSGMAELLRAAGTPTGPAR